MRKPSKKDEKKRRKLLTAANKILMDDDISHVYVIKNGLYYRPNSCGYTSRIFEAGVFPKENHKRDMMDDNFNIVPVDVGNHNDMIWSKIESLKERLISEIVD